MSLYLECFLNNLNDSLKYKNCEPVFVILDDPIFESMCKHFGAKIQYVTQKFKDENDALIDLEIDTVELLYFKHGDKSVNICGVKKSDAEIYKKVVGAWLYTMPC